MRVPAMSSALAAAFAVAGCAAMGVPPPTAYTSARVCSGLGNAGDRVANVLPQSGALGSTLGDWPAAATISPVLVRFTATSPRADASEVGSPPAGVSDRQVEHMLRCYAAAQTAVVPAGGRPVARVESAAGTRRGTTRGIRTVAADVAAGTRIWRPKERIPDQSTELEVRQISTHGSDREPM